MRNYLLKSAYLIVVLGYTGVSLAAQFQVDDFGDADDANLEDGICSTAAQTCTLRAAVQQANKHSGTRIALPDGTYELTSGKEITITSNMQIVGGGPDKVVISGKRSSRVFGVRGGAFATISGVSITQGKAYNGGAIGVWGSSKLALVNSAVTDSSSENKGAGLYASVSVVSIDNTTFSDNKAGGLGGAIYITGSKSWLRAYGSSFERNSSISGGGIYCDSAAYASIEETLLDSNKSLGNNAIAGGGAVYSRNCSITLGNTTLVQNSAEKRGGALYAASKGSFAIDASSFSRNRAVKEDGGAIYSEGALAMHRVTLSGNTGWFGSALYDAGSSTMTMVTVADNQARNVSGGAVYHNSAGDMALNFSTITRNSGGNIVNEAGGLQMGSSLVASAVSGPDCLGSISSVGYNLDSDGSCGLGGPGDKSSVNPLLVAVQGGTLYEPGSGSPAIDSGSSSCPGLDQRYFTRQGACDIGALEAGGTAARTGTVEFRQTVGMVREGDGSATITLTRSGGSDGDVSVRYQAEPTSTARAGFDFIDFDGVLEWKNGESGDKSFQISIVADGVADERIEPLIISLGNPTGGVEIGTNRTTTLNIVDDAAQFGELAFEQASYTVAEDAGSLEITVRRSNGDVGEVSVAYATADKEATAGQDYTAVSGTLVFADRETTRTITIPISRDREREGDETFIIQLSGITGGAVAGAYDSAVITISDDEPRSGASGGSSGNSSTASSGGGGGGGGGSHGLLLLLILAGLLLRNYSASSERLL